MNSLFVNFPYKSYGTWMFDDAAVGLKGEPFVAGADTILDHLTERVVNAEQGFRLIFAPIPFPGFQMKLDWVREDREMPGNWYRWAGTDLEGWLCPALFHYFENAPPNLFVKAEPLSNPLETHG